jgi:tRNA-uridine 2-sulfurtransferase
MNNQTNKVKGLGLCSGGLDSILSALVLRDQGIDVSWISFETPFFSAEKARRAAAAAGIPLLVMDITERYLAMLKNPPCGYGKHMNPCMDCHALMFRIAGENMASVGADFLFSGEVVGQRPMSQTRQSLRYVEKRSGYDGLILRPLSARLLPETDMEKRGLVDRSRLGDLSGRSRKPQMAMAETFGVRDYPSPAGGCLLTDKGFSLRLKDLFDHQETYAREEFELLKHGRHMRLDPETRLIIGRNRSDNERILSCYQPDRDFLLKTEGVPGPIAVIPDGSSSEQLARAAEIVAGYSKAPADGLVNVRVVKPDASEVFRVKGLHHSEVRDLLIPIHRFDQSQS